MIQSLTYFLLFLWVSLQASLNVEEGNRLRNELSTSLKQGNFTESLTIYQTLQSSRYRIPPALRLQVANAAVVEKDTALARKICEYILRSNDPQLMRMAYNELGVLHYNQKRYKSSLAAFKQALDTDPSYKIAAFNYELVSRKIAPSSQSSAQSEQQFQNSSLTEMTDLKEDLLSKTPPPQIGRERALLILDALRTNEGQGFLFKPKFKRNHQKENNW